MIEKSETYSAKAEVSNVRKRRTRWERIWLDLKKAPPTMYVCVTILTMFAVVFGIGATWLYDWASMVSEQISNPQLYINAMKSII